MSTDIENKYFALASKITVSLVICTKNRSESLKTCLDYVAKNNPPFSWELILVDNASTDNTSTVIHTFILNLDKPAKGLYVTEAGNGAGRNAAIKQCRGDIIAFTDDDCYVDENFIKEIAKVFVDPKMGYMSGRIMLFDKTDYPITINESMDQRIVEEGQIVGGAFIHGANMAFRRSALVTAGLFDPIFGAGAKFAGEDWELAMRISADGWRGGYFPDPIVWHHHGRKEKDAKRLHKFYVIGEGALYAKGMLNKKMASAIRKMFFQAAHKNCSWRSKGTFYYLLSGMFQYWFWRMFSGSEKRND